MLGFSTVMVDMKLNNNIHKQVPVKVTAYVDEGIKELIEILNSIPEVCTIESCEGNMLRPASISLDYGIDYTNQDNPNINKLVAFADRLSGLIRNAELQNESYSGISDGISISIEWHPRYHPTLFISVYRQYIRMFINILLPLCIERKPSIPQSSYENLEAHHHV